MQYRTVDDNYVHIIYNMHILFLEELAKKTEASNLDDANGEYRTAI